MKQLKEKDTKKISFFQEIKQAVKEGKEAAQKENEEFFKKYNLPPNSTFSQQLKAIWKAKSKKEKIFELVVCVLCILVLIIYFVFFF